MQLLWILLICVVRIHCINVPADTNGVMGYYFNNTALSWPPSFTRVDQAIDMKWNSTYEPAPGVSPIYFSILWLGMITIPSNDTYTFATYGNAGVRMWLGGHLLIDDVASVTPRTNISVINTTLSTQSYTLRVEMYKLNTSEAFTSLQVMWKITGSSSPFSVVPSEYISPEVSNTTMQEVLFFNSVATGWNTWNNKNTLSHVLLPSAFSVTVGYADTATKQYVNEVVVECNNDLMSGLHAPFGNYTEISSFSPFNNLQLHIESAQTSEGDIVLLVTPLSASPSSIAVVTAAMLWSRVGFISFPENKKETTNAFLKASFPGLGGIEIFSTVPPLPPVSFLEGSYAAFPISSAIGLSSGYNRSLAEIQKIVATNRAPLQDQVNSYGNQSELYTAMHTVISWNTIFDPHEGVITPVSRGWDFGAGYVLFDWDNYFYIAYGNLLRITNAEMIQGFVPNYESGLYASRDRSEPPVGAMSSLAVYNKFGEKWILESVYPNLLTWNKWWWTRRDEGGLMVWGSENNLPATPDQCTLQAARYESGLDNSPMYDSPPVVFNASTYHMQLWDIGLNSLLIRDCQDLAKIATILGYHDDAEELMKRGEALAQQVNDSLWDDASQLYINKISTSLAFYPRLSPTSFYPLLAGIASDEQALAMMEHLTNISEFCVNKACKYAIPSISRNDPAFHDNNYWRGRIWGPMNFLVYLGLLNYDHISAVHDARLILCEQAANLLLGDWLSNRHVQENYNSVSGEGCDVTNADPFYHWGALNAFINILEYSQKNQ